MGNNNRGGLSKREYARIHGGSSSGGSSSSGGGGGFNLRDFAGQIGDMTSKYYDFSSQVQRLPFDLKDAFREGRSKELDEQINKSETDYGNAGFEGLSKYENVTDPIARRALAEKYQGNRGTDYKNLLSEKDRREGKYADYIEKWSGLYSAEASRQQGILSSMKEQWNMQNTLSQQENSEKWRQMEWDNKMSQQNRSNAKSDASLSDDEMRMKIAELENQGMDWHSINEYMKDNHGTDISQGGTYDVAMHGQFDTGYTPQKMVQNKQPTTADLKFEQENIEQDNLIAGIMTKHKLPQTPAGYQEALRLLEQGDI